MEDVAKGNRSPALWLKVITMLLLVLCVCCAEIPHRENKHRQVRLQVTDNHVIIRNGIVEVTIENPSGYLTGIRYKKVNNILEGRHRSDNRGYWDIISDHCPMDRLVTKNFKVITRTDEIVELSFTKKWNSTTDYHKTVPLNIDKRFIVRRGVPGLYMYGIFEREEDFPDASMDHIRIAFKLREDRFRFMALSDSRQRIMPSTDDRSSSRARTLAFKEAVVLTNPSDPQLKGEVDDKYQYSTENKDNKLHGWISDDDAVGFWIITPSSEFRAGGPHKQGLTSHPGATSLCMLVTAHYAGKDFDTTYKKGEHWKKVFGPAFIYLNSASSSNDHRKTLWMDAKRQLNEEIESWPYNFTRSQDFPHAEQRGEVSGQLLVRDRYTDKGLVPAQSAFVVLAAPGDAGSWQRDGKGYQFWTQADTNGHFDIKNVRPGEYNLYAWVHGFIGDYKLDLNITIQPGNKISLGTLIYDPPRNGPTLWEIGIPDRTASEFFIPEPDPMLVNSLCLDEADKYRQYGLWDRYSDIYSHSDLVYTIGTSNYSQDWFFAHVPRNVRNNTLRPTTWQIKYNLQEITKTGTYTLQLALASASFAEVQVRFNDPDAVRPHFTTRRIGYDNAVARHGIHGIFRLYSIEVTGNRFEKGENTIFLTQSRSKGAFNAVITFGDKDVEVYKISRAYIVRSNNAPPIAWGLPRVRLLSTMRKRG
ncbi:hypothetical protein V6N13_123959 [Hibiscus sabdariffa]